MESVIKKDYRAAYSINSIRAYLDNAKIVAFDFETAPNDEWRCDSKAALDAHRAHIVGCSFSKEVNTGIYVPIAHRRFENIDKTLFFTFLKEFLENESTIKIAHNLAFESMFSYSMGIVIQEPVYDTIAASQLALKDDDFNFTPLQQSGLKQLATDIFNEPLPTFEDVTNGRFFDELDPRDFETVRYGCADSDYALKLYYYFNDWFQNNIESHRYVVEKIESPAAVYTGIMKYNGVPFNKERMLEIDKMATAKIDEIKQKIEFIVGDVKIGDNAGTDAFKNYIFNTLNVPVFKMSNRGRPLFDDEVVLRIKDWAKENDKQDILALCDYVIEYRKWQKLKSTYVDGYLKFIKDDNRIYPNLMPLATDTGRYACNQPNIQNIPRKGQDPLQIRNFIEAPDGFEIVEGDYSQAELKIAAFLSNDEVLLDAIKNHVDIHAITTSTIFQISIEEAKNEDDPMYKDRRATAKATIFGTFYGIGGAGLARNLYTEAGLVKTKEECNAYINKLLNKYHGYKVWQIDTKRQAKYKAYVETALGRRRYLKDIRSKLYGKVAAAERMAINTPVQGLCADLLKLSMGRFLKELTNYNYIKPIFTVHDSLIFLVKSEFIENAKTIIHKCMETMPPIENFIGLTADVKSAKLYGGL